MLRGDCPCSNNHHEIDGPVTGVDNCHCGMCRIVGTALLYPAGMTGRFFPMKPRERIDTLQWLFWQLSFGAEQPERRWRKCYADRARVTVYYRVVDALLA